MNIFVAVAKKTFFSIFKEKIFTSDRYYHYIYRFKFLKLVLSKKYDRLEQRGDTLILGIMISLIKFEEKKCQK